MQSRKIHFAVQAALSAEQNCGWFLATSFFFNSVLNTQVVERDTVTQVPPETQREFPLSTDSAADTNQVPGETARVVKPKPAATRQETKLLVQQANVGQQKWAGNSQRTSTTR